MKIESYNKIIWAIIGTGAMGVFLLGTISVLVSFLPFKKRNSIVVDQRKPKDISEKVLVYYNPVISDFSEYIMIPVGFKNIAESRLSKIGSYSSYGSSGSYSVSGIYYKYRGLFNNIVFKNKNQQDTFLLLDKKALITCFYYPYKYCKEKDADVPKFLMFSVIEKDTNGDNLINDDDAENIYLANMSGKNMKRVNPENTKLINWTLNRKDKKIYLRLRTDSNLDKKFTKNDKMEIIVTDVENPSLEPVFLINEETKQKIRKILEK